jgi:hypothetical protein
VLVHPPDKLQNTLDYLNYSGVVFHRDNDQFFEEKKLDRNQSKISTMEEFLSRKPKITKKCLLCTTVITNDQYKVLGRRVYLCSHCKPLFTEITIIQSGNTPE